MRNLATVFIPIFCLLRISMGLYIRSTDNEFGIIKQKLGLTKYLMYNTEHELSEVKHKLGLTNKGAEILKSQEHQPGTVDLLRRHIVQTSQYSEDDKPHTEVDDIIRVFRSFNQQMKHSEKGVKTSLHFELADALEKRPKRHRRKIAVKVVSELSSERVDDLLQIFNKKHGIGYDDTDEDDDDYSDFPTNLPSAIDPDYMYENLYEDEVDLAIPAKSRHSSEYGSFQDLILKASHSQWQRHIDETKLHAPVSKHFI